MGLKRVVQSYFSLWADQDNISTYVNSGEGMGKQKITIYYIVGRGLERSKKVFAKYYKIISPEGSD